jgi:gluconolactonase
VIQVIEDQDVVSVSLYAEVGGAPNGLAVDADGELYVAQAGSRALGERARDRVPPGVQRVSNDGVERVLSSSVFNAPNDLTFDQEGRLWFTDPAGEAIGHHRLPGRLWCWDPGATAPELAMDGLWYPNGLGFSPDGSTLYIAETSTQRILRVPVNGVGVGEAEVHLQMQDGHPDGLTVDASGSVLVATTTGDAVLRVSPSGAITENWGTGPGSFPTNLCLGGTHLDTMFVTLAGGGRVVAWRVDFPGLAR